LVGGERISLISAVRWHSVIQATPHRENDIAAAPCGRSDLRSSGDA
jgi:hypothetical protein